MSEIDVRPVSPILGADVDAGDVRKLSAAGRAQLKQAVIDHQVVFLRDQDLKDDDLEELAATFGEPIDQGMGGLVGALTRVSTYAIDLQHPPRADLWHTDLSFLERPPGYAFLYNVEAPAAGGDTVWASSYAAWDALSPALQRLCAGLSVEHFLGHNLEKYVRERSGDEKLRDLREMFPARQQPLVIKHPHTGRLALYLTDNFHHHVVGLLPHEEAALLPVLRRPYDNPNNQVRIRWQPGSLAIFDERATNHRGLSDHWPDYPRRTTSSVFIDDGIPIGSIAYRG